MRPSETKNLYARLGISEYSSIEEIKKAYREGALKWHPDICSDKNARLEFLAISEAYENLINPQKRKYYDSTQEFEPLSEKELINLTKKVCEMLSDFIVEKESVNRIAPSVYSILHFFKNDLGTRKKKNKKKLVTKDKEIESS